MSEFLSTLHLIKIPHDQGKITWRLDTPLLFRSSTKGRIHVGAGFETDFNGPERVPIGLFVRSPTQAAQVVYDYLCQEWIPVSVLTKAQGIAVLGEAMEAEGVPAWRRWLVCTWMRVFN